MKKSALVILVVLLVAGALPAAGGSRARSSVDPPIISWQPPATNSPALASGRATLAEIGGGPVPFYPITPCRQYDSRSATPLAHNTPRTVTLSGAPCDIPTLTNAIAVNITIFNISGATGNGVFWVDRSSPPTVAWINYPPTEAQRGNAGVVAVTSGSLVVQVNQGAGSVDFVVDVFGYYPDTNFYHLPAQDYFPIAGDRSGGMMILGRNFQTTGANSYGVSGWTNSTGAGSAGIEGRALGATGVVYGVKGLTSSATLGAAGVYGQEASGASGGTTNGFAAGVIGSSAAGPGVKGISDHEGVHGEVFNGSGALMALGILGFRFGSNYYGVYSQGDFGGTGAKYFVEPHPTDASRVIRYIALEGPESGTYFRGTARTVGGKAVIEVPESFRMVSTEEDLTVQLTPVGALTTMAVMSQDLNNVVVRSQRDVTFHYLVQGVRRAFKGFEPIVPGGEFAPTSAGDTLAASLPEEVKQRLVANGTYNPDGTVNMATAERLGWTRVWAERDKPKEAKNSQAPPQ